MPGRPRGRPGGTAPCRSLARLVGGCARRPRMLHETSSLSRGSPRIRCRLFHHEAKSPMNCPSWSTPIPRTDGASRQPNSSAWDVYALRPQPAGPCVTRSSCAVATGPITHDAGTHCPLGGRREHLARSPFRGQATSSSATLRRRANAHSLTSLPNKQERDPRNGPRNGT